MPIPPIQGKLQRRYYQRHGMSSTTKDWYPTHRWSKVHSLDNARNCNDIITVHDTADQEPQEPGNYYQFKEETDYIQHMQPRHDLLFQRIVSFPSLTKLLDGSILTIKWFGSGISNCIFSFRLPSHGLNGESKLCGQLSCLICLFLSTSHVHLLFMPKQDNFDLANRCGEIADSILAKTDPSAHLFVSPLDFLTFISSTF